MYPSSKPSHSSNTNVQDTIKGSQQNKMKPSQLLSKQLSGNALEELNHKPKIVQFLNIADFSSYTDSAVPMDEPLFEPIPSIIQFNDYEPLQVKEKILSLRNKDKYARRIKIIPPDSRLFQVLPYNKTKKMVVEEEISKMYKGSKVAPGMEINFLVKFSPEAKIDYTFDLVVVTEREKFITPIIATGKRAMIDFPDVLDFSHCPVKYCTEKPIVIRNVGEKTTKWFLTLPPPFDADRKEGVLENGKNEQVIIKFNPTESKEYNLEGVFSYDNLKAYFNCTGKAHDGQVYLSKSHIQMDDAYIGLQTQQTLQIVNKSNVKVDFQWRAFQTEKEEIEKKHKLKLQLDAEEVEERMLLKEMVQNDLNPEDLDLDEDDSDREDQDEQNIILKKQKKSEMLLARKFKNIRKAIEDDLLLFQDDIFRIEPTSGQIWPNSALTITVTFEPLAALNYSCTAFCNISCKEERLPLNLAGEGIGPKAVITPQDDIDLGDITITAIKTKDFTIENRGEIPASFQLLFPDTPAARMFKFDVDKGVLGVGERLNFTVTFQSEMLGEFSETFRFKLEGSTELIPLRFRGHVTGPSFKFDKKEIDFGNVSYSFPKKEHITLINTSPVSFRFSLWIPGDGPYEHREFEIHPQRDVINKGEQRTIEITFTPNSVKRYELTLKIDILGVGEGLFSIPIFGESFVPVVKIRPQDVLDFGHEVFLRHPTTTSLELINESDLPAKFEVVPQSKESKILAVYTTDRERGTIEKNSTLKLNITLETFKLGEINLPFAIQVVGNNNLPHVVSIIANSRGPIVEVSEKELDFGNVEVLKDWTKTIRVSNKSLIKADFNIFTKNKQSIFRPLQKHGILEPETTMEIQIVCTPDDNVKFADILHFVIKEGFDIDVPLRAKGVGPTVFCKEDLRVVSFGLQYTFKYDHREIFIENKGRRPQKLVWQFKKKPEPKKNKIENQPGKEGQVLEEEKINTFTIVPENVMLPPKTGLMFQFRSYSTKKGKINEEFELVATAGNDRKSNALYFTVLEGEFIEPNLLFSEKQLYFKYSWEKNVPFMPIVKNLELTCSSQLPTNFQIKVPSPFSVGSETFSLLPGRSTNVKVAFDPGLKIDKVSGQTHNKLQIIHIDHPHREYVNLIGEVCFPNLKLETGNINFGSIMYETTKKMTMIMQNVSEMALNYEWHFMDEEIMRERPSTSQESQHQILGKEGNAIAINEIFDILPLNGCLAPGETEKVEFVFNALLSQKIRTTAVCSVDGGPDYEVRVVGDSSVMTYRLNPKIIDFGIMNFNDWEAREIILENTGKVTFEFKVNLSSVVRENLVEVIPLSGSVKGFEKQRIIVRMCPGLPDIIDEHFFIEVAHFEPERINLRASAIYPTLGFSLPRKENPNFLKHLDSDKLQIDFSRHSESKTPEIRLENDSVLIHEDEIEADRRLLCEVLSKNLNEMQIPSSTVPLGGTLSGIPTLKDNKMFSSSKEEQFGTEESKMHSFMKSEFKKVPVKFLNPKVYDKIILASYTCDLENIVLGASKKKIFKIKNVGTAPVAFSFDQKVYRILNITIVPDRVPRLAPGESVSITLTYQTKKNHKFGRNRMSIPIDVKGGPRYHVDVLSNITIPEITIPSDIIDFEKVIIGQRKTIFVRFENNKEVSCDWSLSTRTELVSITDKEGVRFWMNPTSGLIKPGKKQMIEFTFIPLSEKAYTHKFTINIRDNPKVMVIQMKATGTSVSLEFNPESLDIGPVLPYDNKALTKLSIYNPSEYDTELYSLNFDPLYTQEEEFLKHYDPFDANETMYFNVRYPGQPFWEDIRKAFDLKQKRIEYDKKMKELTSQAQIDEAAIENLQKEIDEFNAANVEKPKVIYPPKVKDHLKHHVIIFGPKQCGKTQLANFLSKTHQRHIVNMNEVLDWNLERETEVGIKAKQYLEQKKVEYDQLVLEREKNKKKRKKGEEEPEIKKEDFECLPEDLLIELLKNRINIPDCNAGVIFDNISASFYPREIDGIRLIMNTLPDQHVQLVNLYHPVDASGLEASQIIYPPPAPDVEQALKDLLNSRLPSRPGARPTTKEEGRTREKKPTQIRIKSAMTKERNKENKSIKEIPKQIEKIEREVIPEGENNAEKQVEKEPLFEINYPAELSPEELKLHNMKANFLIDVILGQYKEPVIPVKEEKKEDKKDAKKDSKALLSTASKAGLKDPKQKVPEVIPEETKIEEPEEPKIEVPKQTLVTKDNRSVISLPIIYNYQQFNYSILENVPEPQFPDMDKEPVPEPVLHQILRRPPIRPRFEKMKNFTVLTPKENFINEADWEIPLEEPLENTTINTQTRWVVPAKQKITLYIKLFAKSPGNYEADFDFETYFSTKGYKIKCLGICDFPAINSNPINVFMQRKKVRPPQPPESYISKHFITQENVFDFGPLLIGKDPTKKDTNAYIYVNSSVFRMTNNGKYDAELEFSFGSSVIEGPVPKGAGPEGSLRKKGIFLLEHEKLTLKMDQTEDLRVWAFPDTPNIYRDQLICMVKNNPVPIIFDLQCTGVKPTIQLSTTTVEFQRILLNQSITEVVKVTNVCAVPVKWKVSGLQDLPEEFSVQNTSGVLKPTQEAIIEINFKGIKQQKFQNKIIIEAEDNENIGIKQPPMEVKLLAEAFRIDVVFDPNNPENMLNFGDVRVEDTKEQKFPIKNIGLYDIKYRFTMKKKLFRDNFKIEPIEGVIAPNQEKVIVFKFCSQQELKLKTTSSTTDIVLEILEGKSLEIFNKVMINVTVNAVFSKYSITPINTINFGPVQFEEPKIRHFEIKNEGIFEFNYIIFDYNDDARRREILEEEAAQRKAEEEAAAALAAGVKGKQDKGKPDPKKKPEPKPSGKKDPKKVEVSGLSIGPWNIDPPTGTIAPDSSQTIKVTFKGIGQKLFEQKLGLHISRRDTKDQPKGIIYEVVGESCIPGINTEGFESIFEEQIVVPSLINSQNLHEKVNSNVFSIEEKTFYFGTVVHAKNPKGIQEQFKITNPGKIPCTVKFDVKKRSNSTNEQFAFKVTPSNVTIMPHHYKYVTVSFEPEIIASYGGVFEAIVEKGEQNPKTGRLLFDLRGDCALPTLKIERPRDWADDRTPLLKFPKTRLDKSCILPIVLKNDGQIPATAEFELKPHDCFKFLDPAALTISAKTSATFNVEFKPREPGLKQWEIIVKTRDNPYENPRLMLRGEGYQEDIIFEGLPQDLEDEIHFGDSVINIEKKISFQIKNNSNGPIRFKWDTTTEDFVMTPRVGHLHEHSAKWITCTFKSQKTVTYKDLPMICQIQGIAVKDTKDWDDSMVNTRYVTKTEYDWYIRKFEEEERKRKEEEELTKKKGAKKDAKKPAPKGGKGVEKEPEDLPPRPDPNEEADMRLEEPIPEPEHQFIEKTEKNLTLKANAVSDYVKYDCETREIFFAPTLMFTSRIFTFNLKNTSLIQMKYVCKIVSAETGVYDNGYFGVSPKAGVVNSGCDETITLKFSPKEVERSNARLLVISIENLDPTAEKLIIELDGEAERPVCHFELPPSLLKDKRAQILAQEGKYQIIEFESLGTKIKNSKRFYVVNPTNQGYEFEWSREIEEAGKNTSSSFFKCLTTKGTILSGKKFDMIFEYLPDTIGNHESNWVFKIPSEKITHHFAFIGNVIEPNVFLEVGSINFGPLLLSGKNKEIVKLKNLEHVPFTFSFDKISVKGDNDYGDSLAVHPMSGVVGADSETSIEITFQPKYERSYNYNLVLNVKQKTRPINLNIKGHGYSLHHSVNIDSALTPISNNVDHTLDFGDIYINERKTKVITINNSGDFNFDIAIKKSQFSFVTISPENATVLKNEKVDIEVTFTPITEYKLRSKSHYFTLSIVSGPTYYFRLSGSARKPGVEFSFLEYDFGPSYVLKQPLPRNAVLEISNNDTSAMSIESLFEKTNYLDIQLAPGQVILPTNQSRDNLLKVPITFIPREFTKYEEDVIFDVNGLHNIAVKIKGEGVPLKLELEKSEHSNIDFGVVGVGADVTKIARLVNYGKRTISLNLNVQDQLEILRQKFAISIYPDKDFTLQPKEGIDIEVRFNPTNRIHQFKNELFYQIVENKETYKLLNIMGCCHGIELKLHQDTVGFGSVVVNSKLTREIRVENLGDVNAKFSWDTTYCKRYFTITPSQGVIPAHEDFIFSIIFHPDVIDNDISFPKVKCEIENSNPLYINLFGKGIPQTKESIQEVKFKAVVRNIDKQKIIVKNPTDTPWKIKASINTTAKTKNYFSGNEYLEVPKNGQAEYEITYRPLTMTKNEKVPEIEEETHEASLFFPTPDGSALLYNLVGVSLPPTEAEVFNINIKAKKSEISVIPVKNWLKTTQRFGVKWEVEGNDPNILIKGASTIDIAGEGIKDYKLTLYGLKAGAGKAIITFKNDQTGEYIFYRLNINIAAPDVIETFEMTSFVRETVNKLIIIENPLTKPVQFLPEHIVCDCDAISFNPTSFTIQAQSEFGLEILYRPLVAGERKCNLTVKSPDLGDFPYQIKLVALPPTSQKSMTFKTPLGTDLVQKFKFTHYLKKQIPYTIRVERIGQGAKSVIQTKEKEKAGKDKGVIPADFIPEVQTITVPAATSYEGVDQEIGIRFEPSILGESRGILIISSPEGGEYQCLLIGTATPPVPKGPIKIGAKSATVEFKNPFFEPQQFTIRLDNPSFTTTAKTITPADSKKVINIPIVFKPVQGYLNTGRLIIQSGDLPAWIYYLQGE